mmetsp:Transcript_11890/g.29426  ORF Transcript_11890/g.29426 Transcript_11890/m.29426 type:complete len:93 (+) Transcript_11890:89-367(+)
MDAYYLLLNTPFLLCVRARSSQRAEVQLMPTVQQDPQLQGLFSEQYKISRMTERSSDGRNPDGLFLYLGFEHWGSLQRGFLSSSHCKKDGRK